MAAMQWLYSPVSTKVSEKTGIYEIACSEMRNLCRQEYQSFPGIGSIDEDNQRAGATDRLARLIRPLWTGDNGPRCLPGHISERRLAQDGLRLQQLGDFGG